MQVYLDQTLSARKVELFINQISKENLDDI